MHDLYVRWIVENVEVTGVNLGFGTGGHEADGSTEDGALRKSRGELGEEKLLGAPETTCAESGEVVGAFRFPFFGVGFVD